MRTVSVVIPCFNVEDYVAEAIESVLEQTHPVEQVICVDDGSTDGTLYVLNQFEHSHPSVTVLTGSNGGGNHARNRGLEHVLSDYVQFLDADDVLEPNKIEHQVRAATANGREVDVIIGGWQYLELDGHVHKFRPGDASAMINLARTSMGRTSSILWKTKSVRDVGGWNEDWASSQETELMYRLLANGATFDYDREVRTTIRKRAGSVTDNRDVQRFERLVRLRVMILDHAHDSGAPAEDIRVLEQILFGWIRKLYFVSPLLARRYHSQYIPNGFIPDPDLSWTPSFYCWLYRFVGLRGVESLRSVIPRRVIAKLKNDR